MPSTLGSRCQADVVGHRWVNRSLFALDRLRLAAAWSLVTLNANSDAISAQQHLAHQAPCFAPIRSARQRPSRQGPSREPSGLRHLPRQTSLRGSARNASREVGVMRVGLANQ
jgi:hypothetical protein